MGKIQVGGGSGGGGGRGTSSSLVSATKLGEVRGPTGQTLTAGGTLAVTFTGGTVALGEAYWGVPGSALDLLLTVNGDGNVVLPDDDKTYDVALRVHLTCDAADVGKLVGLHAEGDNVIVETWAPVVAGNTCDLRARWVDQVFTGDGPIPMAVTVLGGQLSANATVTVAPGVFVAQR